MKMQSYCEAYSLHGTNRKKGVRNLSRRKSHANYDLCICLIVNHPLMQLYYTNIHIYLFIITNKQTNCNRIIFLIWFLKWT